MRVSASPSLNVTAAAHSAVAVVSQTEHVGREAGRVPEGAGCWSSGYKRRGRGWGGGSPIMPGFGSKLYNRIQVLPKAPASSEQIQ